MKKVLIITYYWPPSGGVGVQRWLKFSKYLPNNNWSPIIYTPDNPHFDLKDNSLENDLPSGVKVIRRPIWEPFNLYRNLMGKKGAPTKQGVVAEDGKKSWLKRVSIWLRGNLFLPDPRVFWVKPSIKFLMPFVKAEGIDLIVTTGPPHSMHLIGLGLKKKLGIKWLVDFRDPWSDWDLLPRLHTSGLAMKWHRKKESEVLSNCDGFTTVTPGLGEKYSDRTSLSHVITNGFDGRLFESTETPDKFRISHVGMFNEIKNPELLWDVLEELATDDHSFAQQLEICLAGVVSQNILNRLQSGILKGNTVYKDYLSHQEVYKLYRQSFALLICMNQTDNASWIIPVKLFEYLQTGKEILALGVKKTDANTVLKEFDKPEFIEFDNHKEIKQRVVWLFKQYQEKNTSSADAKTIKYSREKLTEQLSVFMDQIVS